MAISGLMTGMLLAALDQTIVATALKTIVESFDGLNHYALVVTAYLLPATASTLLYGRISDLYGRRSVFRFAIAVFLLGSVLAGFSQSMTQLVIGRAVQGLGAGGLATLTFIIIGDIVPARERGRYQGLAGAVWCLAAVVGPVLGGVFSDRATILGLAGWRWMFLVNLPLGMLALSVAGAALRLPFVRRDHQIDYLGAGLVVGSVSSLVLALAWAGPENGWAHPTTVSLAAAGAVLAALLVVCELRVPEPILPLRLFTNRVFATTSAVAGIVGVAMFGTIVMIPLYLQIVRGTSATSAGSQMLPFVIGYTAMSVLSGKAISRTGSYKAFPVAGTAFTAIGLGLLSLIDVSTPSWLLALFLFLVGGGLGLTIQPLLVAVQGAVEPSDMGVATSANVFFRSFGSTVGTAMFAAIFAGRLGENLEHTFATLTASGREALAGIDVRSLMANAERIKTLPIGLQASVLEGFTGAFQAVFLVAVSIALLGTVVALFTGPSHRRPMTASADAAASPEDAVEAAPA
jgi:EmrB/QacA subfamily drug resistance transporter